MGITIINSGQGSVVRFRNLGRGGVMTSTKLPSTLLLNNYPGAAAAYSLRKLDYTYTGAAIRVRRSSDNAEQNIGFVNNNLDTASLLAFCGAGSGFVTTWYDQSGNSNNLTQTTTSRQPRVILSGVLEQQLNKPTIKITNNFQVGLISSYNLINPFSIITVIQQEDGFAASARIINSNSLNSLITIKRSDNLSIYTGAAVVSNFAYQALSTPYLINFYRQSSSNYVYQNNYTVTVSSTSSTNWGTVVVGAGDVFGENQNSKISELIIYPTNQLSNNSGINSNINSYYSIYTPTWQGTGTALLDLYPSSAAAYSLRNLSSTYTGPLVRVRRSSDSAEEDIYGTLTGQLDTASLLSFCGAGDGLVTKWYDQSGNTRDVAQTNTSYQPIIVSSGTVALFGDKPSLYFSPVKAMSNNTFTIAQPNTYFIATQGTSANATGDRNIFDGTGGSGRNAIGKSNINSNYFLYAGTLVYSTTPVDNIKNLFVPVFNTTSSFLYKNGNAILSNANPGAQSLQGLRIGAYLDGQGHWESYIPEFIVYNSNQTSNRIAIETNINSYYSIYIVPTVVTTGLVLSLDAGNVASYPGSGTTWTDTVQSKTFTLYGSPTYNSANGGYLTFDPASSQYAESSTSLTSSLGSYTIEAWHYYTGGNSGTSACIVTEVFPGSTSKINYSLGYNTTSTGVQNGFYDGTWRSTAAQVLTINTWNHIVGTYDGATVKLYVNNSLVQSGAVTATPVSSQGGIRFMRRWDTTDYWKGNLAVVRMYTGSLDSTQIAQNFNAQRSRFGL